MTTPEILDYSTHTPAQIDAIWLTHLQGIAAHQRRIHIEQVGLNSQYSTEEAKARNREEIAWHQVEIDKIVASITPLQAEFADRNGWSRFYVVLNANGHIHSSRHCSTCFTTTDYAWLTELSGKTEEEVVALYGEAVCTVCFPSAPVYKGFGDGTSALARYTQAEKDERAAEKAARAAAKTAKALNAPVRVDGTLYETVASAKQGIRDAISYTHYYGDNDGRYASRITALTASLAAKGLPLSEIDTIKARALKKAQKEGL